MEYSRKLDWEINKNVKAELVRRWIDVNKLRISTTKGNVEIKGSLEFTGQGKNVYDSPVTVIHLLKNLESTIKALPTVKSIKFQLDTYKKTGTRWEYTSPKEKT